MQRTSSGRAEPEAASGPDAPLVGFGPRVRKSSYFAATERYGAKAYSIYNRMYIPLYYQDPVSEYWALVEDVALWDVACQRQLEITGPDAARFAQLLTPRNLDKCAVGQCKYALLTAEDGGILNDPVLLRLGENHFWLSAADADILLWARGVAAFAGMKVEVTEPDVSPVQVQGPKSVAVMADLFGDWIYELRYFRFRETELDGMPVVVSRTGWSNELGYEIFLRDGRFGMQLWDRITTAGEPYRLKLGAPSAIRRIEAAILSYGADMDATVNPFELGLGKIVDLEMTADFIGKAALARIKAEGVKRRLVGVQINGSQLSGGNQEPWPIEVDWQRVGMVTSCIHSPRLEQNIGLAVVAIEHAESGSTLGVETPGGSRDATVVPLPFVEPPAELRLPQLPRAA